MELPYWVSQDKLSDYARKWLLYADKEWAKLAGLNKVAQDLGCDSGNAE